MPSPVRRSCSAEPPTNPERFTGCHGLLDVSRVRPRLLILNGLAAVVLLARQRGMQRAVHNYYQ